MRLRPRAGRRKAACWNAIRDLARLPEVQSARRGRLVHLAADEKTYVYARTLPKRSWLRSTTVHHPFLAIPVAELGLREGQALTPIQGGPSVSVASGTLSLSLPPRSATLLRVIRDATETTR